MKKVLLLFAVCLSFTVIRAQSPKKIIGKVSHLELPVVKATISVIDKNSTVTTDFDGKYEILCEEGDKLKFEYPGLNTVVIKIEDVTRVLNVDMMPKVTELDEVTVKASGRKSQAELEQEYPYNPRIIRTAFEYLDADRTPGWVQFMTKEEINPIGVCILDVLRSQFAGVRVIGDCARGGDVFMRSTASISSPRPALFDVDGILFTDAPFWLDINNIDRIALFRTVNQTVLYGNLGAGGVIVINTKVGNPRLLGIVDRARLRHNYVSGKVLSKDEVMENMPNYMTALDTAGTFEEAKAVYEEFNTTYSSFPYFQLDAFRYFNEKWEEEMYAERIINKNYHLFRDNSVLLKALAYSYEEFQDYERANDMFKEIFIHRPNYAQSYLDMANSYRDLGEKKMAAGIYGRYQYLLDEGFMETDTISFEPIMNREFNNLLALHKDVVVGNKKSKKLYIAEEEFKGTRLVFEWNDGEAEFNMQFVNPEGQYYTWKHSLADSPEEISREKDYGYNISEYLVDNYLPGTWRVNLEYLGNKSLSPTYLKATVYYGYGTKRQTKETKVFRLGVKHVNQELFHLNIGAQMVTE